MNINSLTSFSWDRASLKFPIVCRSLWVLTYRNLRNKAATLPMISFPQVVKNLLNGEELSNLTPVITECSETDVFKIPASHLVSLPLSQG